MALFLAGRRPWAAGLEREPVVDLAGSARDLLTVPPGVLVPGQDATLAGREAALAARLAALLEAPPVGPALANLAHSAAARGERLTLLLDLRDDALRALPWELLELLVPAESMVAPCRVVRLAEAPGPAAPRGPAHGLEVLLSRLDPADGTCAGVARATLASLDRLPGVRARDLTDGAADAPPTADTGHLRVLHLVSHGRAAMDRVLVALGGERSLDPASAARWVDPVRAGLDLAVLDICGAGSQEGGPGSAPAERLVQEGLPAAVAPSLPVDPAASACFSEALYGALVQGQPLYRAVDAGRRALARLGIPHPSCRWWTPILVVRDAAALERACVADTAGPASWAPQAQAPVLELLGRALELAAVHGFLGVEHLALLLARGEPLPSRLALSRDRLEAIGQRLSAWRAAGEGQPTVTPRLRAMLAGLPTGAGLAELGEALIAVPWVATPALPGGDPGGLDAGRGARPASLETVQPGVAGGPAPQPLRACTLEVEGGPEDGSRLDWTPARPVLGRRDPTRADADAVQLFEAGGAQDPSVSRRHLQLREDGHVVVLGETHLERAGVAQRLEGVALLAPGDLLVLGRATRLRVLTLEPAT